MEKRPIKLQYKPNPGMPLIECFGVNKEREEAINDRVCKIAKEVMNEHHSSGDLQALLDGFMQRVVNEVPVYDDQEVLVLGFTLATYTKTIFDALNDNPIYQLLGTLAKLRRRQGN